MCDLDWMCGLDLQQVGAEHMCCWCEQVIRRMQQLLLDRLADIRQVRCKACVGAVCGCCVHVCAANVA